MDPDPADPSELTLRFSAGRFETSLAYLILIIQATLAAVSLMLIGFMLLSKSWGPFRYFAIAFIPLVVAYLLTFLYE